MLAEIAPPHKEILLALHELQVSHIEWAYQAKLHKVPSKTLAPPTIVHYQSIPGLNKTSRGDQRDFLFQGRISNNQHLSKCESLVHDS